LGNRRSHVSANWWLLRFALLPNGDTFVWSCPAGASCYNYIACNCNQVLCARVAQAARLPARLGPRAARLAQRRDGRRERHGGAKGGASGSTGGANATGGARAARARARRRDWNRWRDGWQRRGQRWRDRNRGSACFARGGRFHQGFRGQDHCPARTALIDIGALYAYGGNSVAGISARMDKIAAAGLQGHVVRLPVYPKIDYNGGGSYCSPLPYPVGGSGSANCTPLHP